MSIAAEWDTFLKRKVLLAGNVAFVYQDKEPVVSTEVTEFVASLLYIDLVTVLDNATVQRLEDLKLVPPKPSLYHRLKTLADSHHLLDHPSLDGIRDTRNGLAHEASRITIAALEEALGHVERQLLAWSYVPARPDYVPFYEASDWHAGSSSPFQREYCIGVEKQSSKERVLSLRFEERRWDETGKGFGVRIEKKDGA